jgi:phosphoenolpyruvate-protein kinase (PTS system EI component)
MHTKSLFARFAVTLSILAVLPLAWFAAGATSVAPDAQQKSEKQEKHGKQEEEQETKLEQAMQAMQSALKQLDKSLGKKDLTAALPFVVEMQRAALAARVETPPLAEDISDAKKKAEFVAGFRKQLIALHKALCDLEIALIDGKADDATRLLDTTIKALKKEGHAKYKGD